MLANYSMGKMLAAHSTFDEWIERRRRWRRPVGTSTGNSSFPEVFFDRYGRPRGESAGFDAVVGNPPYVRQEALGPLKRYFASAYSDVYHGVADLYVYFYHQGYRLVREGGRMSYIVTNKWLRAGYGEPLRTWFAAQGAFEEIIDFGHAPIFEGADVFPTIIVLEKPSTDDALPRPTGASPRAADRSRGAGARVPARRAEPGGARALRGRASHALPRSRFGAGA
ncbi:MAG: Eco57I restriction-modification methylase domain-containing protein [Chloroflexia bacterium]